MKVQFILAVISRRANACVGAAPSTERRWRIACNSDGAGEDERQPTAADEQQQPGAEQEAEVEMEDAGDMEGEMDASDAGDAGAASGADDEQLALDDSDDDGFEMDVHDGAVAARESSSTTAASTATVPMREIPSRIALRRTQL